MLSKQSQVGLFGTRRRGESRGGEGGGEERKHKGRGVPSTPPHTAVPGDGHGRPRVDGRRPRPSDLLRREDPTAADDGRPRGDGRGRPRVDGLGRLRGRSPPTPGSAAAVPAGSDKAVPAWTAVADPAVGRSVRVDGPRRPRGRPWPTAGWSTAVPAGSDKAVPGDGHGPPRGRKGRRRGRPWPTTPLQPPTAGWSTAVPAVGRGRPQGRPSTWSAVPTAGRRSTDAPFGERSRPHDRSRPRSWTAATAPATDQLRPLDSPFPEIQRP
ncbi:hypothetical protein KC19_VG263500 [Ceratodon purpureus]|uniref:Uncharacterized protein n=1 Tax=Ceratodon purpureus TaxID=3225 RepID=A0A8T0HUI3_CERPU|nr:hypothetical protein KC19_VG263500 [Ceratodon purpureus]